MFLFSVRKRIAKGRRQTILRNRVTRKSILTVRFPKKPRNEIIVLRSRLIVRAFAKAYKTI